LLLLLLFGGRELEATEAEFEVGRWAGMQAGRVM
jgi:hypothetical protein